MQKKKEKNPIILAGCHCGRQSVPGKPHTALRFFCNASCSDANHLESEKKKLKKKRNIKARPAPRRWGRGSRNISDNPPSHSPGRFARRRSPQKRKEQHFVRVARPLASFFTSSTFATVFFLFSPPGGSKRAQTEKLIKRSCLGLPFKCTDKRTLTVIFC